MKYDINAINAALVRAMSELLCGDAQYSAKSLEGTIAIFFKEAATPSLKKLGDESPEGWVELPEGYVYPWRADMESLITMCEAIYAAIRPFPSSGNWELIRKIRELSEQYMAEFRSARNETAYKRNVGYICDLDENNDWGRWMLALKQVFATPEEIREATAA